MYLRCYVYYFCQIFRTQISQYLTVCEVKPSFSLVHDDIARSVPSQWCTTTLHNVVNCINTDNSSSFIINFLNNSFVRLCSVEDCLENF